jgi:hypothetical protein
MKKLLIICAIFIMLASTSIVTAVQPIKDARVIDPDGSFSGYIGVPKQPDPIIVGNISGIYKIGNRGGGFNAIWDIDYQNRSGSGTVRGFFGKHILLGKLSVEGYNKTLRIIGFIGFDKVNHTFIGRAMSFIGPALYFWGTYEPY